MNRIVLSFDVDGTLTMRGEPLKQEAWDVMARNQSLPFRAALLEYRQKYSGGGGSRYDIIRETLKEIGTTEANIEQETEKLAEEYQATVMSLILSDFRSNARAVLESLKRHHKLYVNSATEEEGLRRCLSDVGLAEFFEAIFGYPKDGSRKKADNLRLILQTEGIDPEFLIHVGDSESDRKAATEVECFFIGISNDDNKWIPEQESFLVINSLSDLEDVIETLF